VPAWVAALAAQIEGSLQALWGDKDMAAQTTEKSNIRPMVIAHRGSSKAAPENTLAAFEQAIQDGADAIEFDVHLTKDGHIVIIHDNTVDRTTDGLGSVPESTLAELKRLDAGGWFHPSFKGERIPTLPEALALTKGRCKINIEIKGFPLEYTGIEERILEDLREAGFPLEDVFVSSFNHFYLVRMKELAPELPVATLFHGLPVSLRDFPGEIVHPIWYTVGDRLMKMVRESGRKVNTYMIDDEERFRRMVHFGVDGMTTNVPALIRRLVDAL